MTVRTRSDPSAREALDLLAPALGVDSEAMVTIIGRCTVEYEGRASSHLGLGDRLVILKPDGSLLVHQDTQRTPVNWQPPGCIHDASLDVTNADGDTGQDERARLHVRSIRRTPSETIDIRFTAVFQLSVFELADERKLELAGSEEDLRQQILAEPDTLEEGFTPLATERATPAGAVDIYGEDQEGTPTVVELKRRRIGPDAVSQLKRYVDALKRDLPADQSVRGLLVAPSVTERAERLLADEELEFVSLAPPDESSGTATTLTEFTPE